MVLHVAHAGVDGQADAAHQDDDHESDDDDRLPGLRSDPAHRLPAAPCRLTSAHPNTGVAFMTAHSRMVIVKKPTVTGGLYV